MQENSAQERNRNISRARCFNHSDREAAVRCPECRRFFCRECVAEHEQRFLCSSCLALQSGNSLPHRRSIFSSAGRLVRFVAALLILWFGFYLLGKSLLFIPDEFHDDLSPAVTLEEDP